MTALYGVLLLVALQRLIELTLAERNARALLAAGAVEHGAGHYPLFFLLQGGWLAAVLLFVPAATVPNWTLLGLYGFLQPFRVWAMSSLGRFFTTRVIVLPGAARVRRGPYRFMRHPIYLVVACEILLLPLAFGAWATAALFSLLNAALLAYRIRVEEAALASVPTLIVRSRTDKPER